MPEFRIRYHEARPTWRLLCLHRPCCRQIASRGQRDETRVLSQRHCFPPQWHDSTFPAALQRRSGQATTYWHR